MKKLLKVLLVAMTVLLFTACGNDGGADDQLTEKYQPKAEEVVNHLNNQEYSEIIPQLDSEMKEFLTEDKLKELEPVIAEAGDFDSITKSSVEEKDGYYVVVLVAKYSNQNLRYTITYDEDDQVAGLFIK